MRIYRSVNYLSNKSKINLIGDQNQKLWGFQSNHALLIGIIVGGDKVALAEMDTVAGTDTMDRVK